MVSFKVGVELEVELQILVAFKTFHHQIYRQADLMILEFIEFIGPEQV